MGDNDTRSHRLAEVEVNRIERQSSANDIELKTYPEKTVVEITYKHDTNPITNE